jgi:Ca2+-binding RTX toxin-like protein
MLGIIGLLGALMAGVVGDALMSLAQKDDDADDAPAEDGAAPPDTGDLLVDDDSPPDAQDTAPLSPEVGNPADDAPTMDPAEQLPPPTVDTGGETKIGTNAGEFIMGTDTANRIGGAGGDDTIDGGAGTDTLTGGAGDDSLTGTDDDAADHLYGGDGDDAVQIGAGDTAWGDRGTDDFTLSDYGPDDPPAVIADYTPGMDRIVLMYDATLHPEPMVQTEAIEGTDDVSVLLDGIQIAIVQGAAGLDFDDIQLMVA